MTTIYLQSEVPQDRYGNKIVDVSTARYDVAGNVTDQEIFSGNGIVSHITIWKDVDGGTVQLKDSSGANITPLAITDYGGSFQLKLLVTNGCKVTTTGFVGGLLSIFYMD
jgi:hypothetical protein